MSETRDLVYELDGLAIGMAANSVGRRTVSDAAREIERLTARSVVIERACVSQGWAVEFEEAKDDAGQSYDEWVFAKLKKVKAASHNPRGLRIVTSEVQK